MCFMHTAYSHTHTHTYVHTLACTYAYEEKTCVICASQYIQYIYIQLDHASVAALYIMCSLCNMHEVTGIETRNFHIQICVYTYMHMCTYFFFLCTLRRSWPCCLLGEYIENRIMYTCTYICVCIYNV